MIASHGLVVPPVTTVQSRPSTTEKLVLAPFHHGAEEPLSKVPLTMCSGASPEATWGKVSAAAGPSSPAAPTVRATTASTAIAGRRLRAYSRAYGMAGRSLQAVCHACGIALTPGERLY